MDWSTAHRDLSTRWWVGPTGRLAGWRFVTTTGAARGRPGCRGGVSASITLRKGSLLLASLGVGGFAVTRGTARDQERRLLAERAGEVAALLTSATSSTASTLRLLGEAYAARQGA